MTASPLATREDLVNLQKSVGVAINTSVREMFSEIVKRDEDQADRWRAHLEDYNRRWAMAAQSLATRTRLWVAGIAALGVIIVGAMTSFSTHSYAVAREQMRETTRQELVTANSALAAHDEILIRRVMAERDALMIVRPK